ncbi:hypothetical protein [Hymenobacter sp. BT190]|uniref:hypothetical protein n=1 Tax=Hymenobacter sp. BT190 TaxID=2763505 RepID=UPI0016511EF9|nr:hypothetical protein [Hymenobacter sp. BT190]MBC6696765.1 hypothetical protein [Hymenobacter sp. BT190]
MSNLGGTLLLGLTLAFGRIEDASIALVAGLLAIIITLPLVPLAVPFLALLSRLQLNWSRRTMAALGVTLFFMLAHQLLVVLLPFLSSLSLLEMTAPYLVAAWATVFWLYSPEGQHRTSRQLWVRWARAQASAVLRMFRREITPSVI